MFSTTFIDKITGVFTSTMLLSGGLPALLLFAWALIAVSRLTDWQIVGLWQSSPTLTGTVAVLGITATAVLIQGLNPILKRWLTGDAPWIPEAFLWWRRHQRDRLDQAVTAAWDRLNAWSPEADTHLQALIEANRTYKTPTDAKQIQVQTARQSVKDVIDRAGAFRPAVTGAIAGGLPSLVEMVLELYRAKALPTKEIESAQQAVTTAIVRTGTSLREAVQARERTLKTLFPETDVVRSTLFGNVQAALDAYPFTRYGMDGVLLWPRLRAAERKPEAWRGVDDAKSVLDFLVAAVWVHVLVVAVGLAAFRLLLSWDPWLLVSCLGGGSALAWTFYKGAIQALAVFRLEVAAAFDLNRWALLDALHLSRPHDADTERQLWQRVTLFILQAPTDEERRNLWYR